MGQVLPILTACIVLVCLEVFLACTEAQDSQRGGTKEKVSLLYDDMKLAWLSAPNILILMSGWPIADEAV